MIMNVGESMISIFGTGAGWWKRDGGREDEKMRTLILGVPSS
jgi:hypothetical protein